MRNSYDVIETANYVILKTLWNFHFGEYFIFIYQFGLKHSEPNIGKIFKGDGNPDDYYVLYKGD